MLSLFIVKVDLSSKSFKISTFQKKKFCSNIFQNYSISREDQSRLYLDEISKHFWRHNNNKKQITRNMEKDDLGQDQENSLGDCIFSCLFSFFLSFFLGKLMTNN